MEYVNTLKRFTDLYAWKEGHKLVLMVYPMTKQFPRDELFGLVSQMRRCVVSITSNLAEGFSRQSLKEKAQFYAIAHGSVTELKNQLLISRDVGYVADSAPRTVHDQSVVVHKLITGLIKATKARM